MMCRLQVPLLDQRLMIGQSAKTYIAGVNLHRQKLQQPSGRSVVLRATIGGLGWPMRPLPSAKRNIYQNTTCHRSFGLQNFFEVADFSVLRSQTKLSHFTNKPRHHGRLHLQLLLRQWRHRILPGSLCQQCWFRSLYNTPTSHQH